MLLKHSFAYVFAKGIPGIVNFAALVIYTRVLGVAEFGRFALVVAITTMAGLVLFQWQRRVVARWLPRQDVVQVDFLGNILVQFLAIGGAAVLAGLLASRFFVGMELSLFVLLGALLFAANNWFELNLSIAAAKLQPGRYGALLNSKAVLSLCVGLFFVWLGFGAYGPLLGLIFGCIASFLLVGRPLWLGVRPTLLDASDLKEQVRYGLPMALTLSLTWVIDSSDRLLIGGLLGAGPAGEYSASYDLAQNSLILLLMIVQVPAFSIVLNAAERGDRTRLLAQIKQSAELIFGIAAAGATGLIVLAPEISTILGEGFRSAASRLLPLIAIGAALGGIKAFHFDVPFHVAKAGRGLVYSAGITAATNVLLNLVLIPRMGLEGAAWATIAAYAVGIVSSVYFGDDLRLLPSLRPIVVKSAAVVIACLLGVVSSVELGGEGEAVRLCFGIVGGAIGAGLGALAVDLAGVRAAVLKVGGRLRAD